MRRECVALRTDVHGGKISVEQYLAAFGGFEAIGTGDTTTPAVSGRIDGPGSLPPVVFTIDDAVVLTDGMTVPEKLADNARRLAAVELPRLTMGNVERPAIDSLFEASSPSALSRKSFNFIQEHEDTRVKVQLVRQPDLFKPKVVVCLGGSPHDETTHEGCLRAFLSCLEMTGVHFANIALAVFLGSDALCHLVCGDQKTIGGLYATARKVATKIKALKDAGASQASPQLGVLCRWWAQLRTCIPKAGDFHVRMHILDMVVMCTGPLIIHPIRNGCDYLPVLPDRFNVQQFNQWDKQARIFYDVMMQAAVFTFLKGSECSDVLNDDSNDSEGKALRLASAFVGFLNSCEKGADITAQMAALTLKLLSAYKARRPPDHATVDFRRAVVVLKSIIATSPMTPVLRLAQEFCFNTAAVGDLSLQHAHYRFWLPLALKLGKKHYAALFYRSIEEFETASDAMKKLIELENLAATMSGALEPIDLVGEHIVCEASIVENGGSQLTAAQSEAWSFTAESRRFFKEAAPVLVNGMQRDGSARERAKVEGTGVAKAPTVSWILARIVNPAMLFSQLGRRGAGSPVLPLSSRQNRRLDKSLVGRVRLVTASQPYPHQGDNSSCCKKLFCKTRAKKGLKTALQKKRVRRKKNLDSR